VCLLDSSHRADTPMESSLGKRTQGCKRLLPLPRSSCRSGPDALERSFSRHTFISRLAESRASDSTVMALAGHVSRAMMERSSHIRMEAKRKAVATLSGMDFEPACGTKLGTIFY
jgi:hypothetical protein